MSDCWKYYYNILKNMQNGWTLRQILFYCPKDKKMISPYIKWCIWKMSLFVLNFLQNWQMVPKDYALSHVYLDFSEYFIFAIWSLNCALGAVVCALKVKRRFTHVVSILIFLARQHQLPTLLVAVENIHVEYIVQRPAMPGGYRRMPVCSPKGARTVADNIGRLRWPLKIVSCLPMWGNAGQAPYRARLMWGKAGQAPYRSRLMWGKAGQAPYRSRLMWERPARRRTVPFWCEKGRPGAVPFPSDVRKGRPGAEPCPSDVRKAGQAPYRARLMWERPARRRTVPVWCEKGRSGAVPCPSDVILPSTTLQTLYGRGHFSKSTWTSPVFWKK